MRARQPQRFKSGEDLRSPKSFAGSPSARRLSLYEWPTAGNVSQVVNTSPFSTDENYLRRLTSWPRPRRKCSRIIAAILVERIRANGHILSAAADHPSWQRVGFVTGRTRHRFAYAAAAYPERRIFLSARSFTIRRSMIKFAVGIVTIAGKPGDDEITNCARKTS